MIFTNCLPEDSYEGEVNGITMSWHQNAKGRLPELAEKYGADAKKLKAMAEHLTHASLVRLGKPTGFILGALHPTTTYAGVAHTDIDHITFMVRPGKWKVHVYMNNVSGDLENVSVRGESVVKGSPARLDKTLSTGDYPKPVNSS